MEANDFSKVSILVVDDSATHRLKLQKYLNSKEFIVSAVENGDAMKQAFEDGNFDLVLLDINLPGDDGFTLMPYLRQQPNIGIIMVTGSDDLVDKVLGLELGADDYITKPFEPRELMARIKSVLRRLREPSAVKSLDENSELISFGEHQLNLASQQLIDPKGGIVELTSMEFDLLKIFAENPGRVLSREFLLNYAHNRDTEPYDRSIDIRIGRIRKKIESNPSKPKVIKTVRGAGYIFVMNE